VYAMKLHWSILCVIIRYVIVVERNVLWINSLHALFVEKKI